MLITVISIAAMACNKDEQADTDTEALVSIAQGVVQKATSGNSINDALASAKAYLDENRNNVAEAAERIKSLKEYQLSDQALAKIKERMQEAGATISRLRVELAAEMARNPAVDQAVEDLIQTYTAAVQGK